MTLAVNIVLFQAACFTSVIGAAHGRVWLGLLAIAVAVAWHLARAPQPLRELGLLAIATAIGLVFETMMLNAGLTRYSSGATLGLAPLWMVAMWMLFATTLNVALRGLRERTWLAALLGAIGGPLAYFGGERLGALQFVDPRALSLLAIALGWALLAPVLLRVAARLDGYSRP